MSEDSVGPRIEVIALSNERTVVAELQPDEAGLRETAYQSEAELEKSFIEQLQKQAFSAPGGDAFRGCPPRAGSALSGNRRSSLPLR